MEMRIAVIAAYFLIVLGVGFAARTRWRSTPEEYFLAGRRLGGVILLGTMAATNFSAFTVFGASGAGYRDGYAFFPIVGFGTGFMALTFWLLGRKIWETGRSNNLVTPSELISSLYGNRFLSFLFAVVMIVFTVPYLALQPMAGGYVLKELFNIPHSVGALLITLVIAVYVMRGGLRAVAWTDVFQGFLMVALLVTALVLVVSHYNGFGAIHEAIGRVKPELMARPGGLGRFTPALWISYLMLWFFCDPMFPQLFQRFFCAENTGAIRRTMLLYPLVCTVVFFLPVTLGVIGNLSHPGLTGKEADRILPLMLGQICGDFMGTMVLSAGLAALMSTMDSQLLTLSSIFTRDIYPLLRRKTTRSSVPGKVFVVFLSIIGLIFAVRPSSTIIQIATQAFTGLAVLFPTVFFGLYLKKPNSAAAVISILAGETLVALSYHAWFPSWGFLPAVPIIISTFIIYLLVVGVQTMGQIRFLSPGKRALGFGVAFTVLFALSIDWWQWTSSVPSFGGFPLWMGYFVFLSGMQTLLMVWWTKRPKV